MPAHALAIAFASLSLEATLILRARGEKRLSDFPLFYSYVVYAFASSVILYLISSVQSQHYPSAFWFYFLVTVLAEFAVLAEISDHVFNPYPAVRRLGRFLMLCISATFLLLYIAPPLLHPRSRSVAILELSKRTSFTKAVIIIVLLAAIRYYRLPLGRNVSGIMLGFSVYLAVSTVNFALAEMYGPRLYARTFALIGPLSYTLSLLIWTISLWRYEPALPIYGKLAMAGDGTSEALNYQLGRFNAALLRRLRK